MSMNQWIYPLSDDSGYVFEGGYDITAGNFHKHECRRPSEWRLSTGFRLAQPGDRLWAYFSGDVREIHGVGAIDSIAWSARFDEYAVTISWQQQLCAHLRRDPIRYDDYRQHVQRSMIRAKPMTVKVFNRWLDGADVAARKELHDISFVRREVTQRTGQSSFRLSVSAAYGGRCAISGCGTAEVLEAAHIRPVKLGGRHSIRNGILLRSDLHTLFDLGLVTVRGGRVQVAPSLRASEYRKFHGVKLRQPAHRTDRPEIELLTAHRREAGWT